MRSNSSALRCLMIEGIDIRCLICDFRYPMCLGYFIHRTSIFQKSAFPHSRLYALSHSLLRISNIKHHISFIAISEGLKFRLAMQWIAVLIMAH